MSDPEFNVILLAHIPLKKRHNRGYKHLTHFIDLGAKQGSIWTVKKGTSLKIIHHSVVE